MLIKRKVYFSAIDEETGEERLFSTTEIMSEESYLEMLYSKKEEKDETKLKPLNRLNVAMYKTEGKFGRKMDKDNLEGNIKESAKNNLKMAAGFTGAGTAVGAIAGGIKGKSLRSAKEGAKVGAAIGGLVGGSTALGATAGTAAVKGLRKVSKHYDTAAQKRLDEIKVAEGKMSKAEFAKKWYKK